MPYTTSAVMRVARRLAVILSFYFLLCLFAGIAIAEASLKLYRRPIRHRMEAAEFVREHFSTQLRDISITASDGVVLRGWYVRPRDFNGSTVLLLHGITDNREGMAGFGRLFLDHGYAVLLPDARRHGESGGELATYGIKESGDVHAWVSWVYAHDQPKCVYGLGESYGAALLLQSLAIEPRFCAVVAESSFSTAREMSYERVSGPLHLRPWFGRSVGYPIIEFAVLYARWRYSIDLLKPSPLDAVMHSAVPVLLIHGLKDHSISPHHSQRIAAAAPAHVQIWLVPQAGHTMAWSAAHQEFENRVLDWFTRHDHANLLAAR
jgi:dipeptidyl aminopeptidase/acylaminoacyl peptidase